MKSIQQFRSRIFFLILFLLVITQFSFGQVGALSGSKLATQCTYVIGHKTVEFEPSFYHIRSRYYWDENRNLETIYSTSDSVKAETGLGFRFTYGLWDRLEIGTSISTDLAVSSWGARFVAYQNDIWGVAAIAGANIPFGNGGFDGKTRLSQLMTSFGGGAVFSASFNKDFSVDVNAQYMFFLRETSDNSEGSWYLNVDLGYYFWDRQFQVIFGAGYQDAVFDDFHNRLLTLYPGITIETGKNYIIVLSTPFDVFGENAFKNFGFNFALTLTFGKREDK